MRSSVFIHSLLNKQVSLNKAIKIQDTGGGNVEVSCEDAAWCELTSDYSSQLSQYTQIGFVGTAGSILTIKNKALNGANVEEIVDPTGVVQQLEYGAFMGCNNLRLIQMEGISYVE